MAAAKVCVGQAEQAICRLVDETSQGKKLLRRDLLGLGCLAKFESVEFLRPLGKPLNSKFFLVASKRAVLTKDHLMAIKKPRKDRKKISVKVFVEFLSMEDSKVLERKDLSELCRSLEEDVYDLNGVTYVALRNQKGSSFLSSRCLEVYNFSEGSESSVLWDQLQCLVFNKETVSETTQQESPVAFSLRIYDLFHCVFAAADDSQVGDVDVSTSASGRRVRKEDEFEKGDVPLGAIIMTKDCQLAGFLDFYNKHPVPLLFGSNFQETGETMTHTGRELQGCTSGSVSCTNSYLSQLAGLRSRLLCLGDYISQPSIVSPSAEIGSENSGTGEMALQRQNLRSRGEGDLQNNKSQGPFPTENSCRHMAAYLPPKDGKIESELPVGAVGGIYTPLESHILAGSHISASGGSNDKSNPGGTAQLGEIKYTLDDKIAAAAEKDTNTADSCEVYVNERSSHEHLLQRGNLQAVEQGETEPELPVGAAGGICPPVDSNSLAESHISLSGGDDKSNTGGNTQPGEVKHNLDDKVAAAAEKDTDLHPSKVKTEEDLAEEENSWAAEQGETGSEFLAGASGGIYPQVKPDSVAGCHISAGGGVDKSDPGGTTLPGVIRHTLDDKVAPAAESDTEFVVNGDHSLEANEVDNTSSEMIPSDGLGCQPVTPLTEISSEGASNTAIKLTKIPSDKAQPRVPPDGTSRSRIIFEEAMAKEATTFPPPPHNHKDTTPSRVVVPPGGLSFQPSLSGGARRVETNTASLPSNNQKDTPPSRTAGVHHPEAVNLPCKSDKDKTATRVPPEGVSFRESSVTTDGNANINPLEVALPIKNSNDRIQSGAKTPSEKISQPSSVTTDRAGNDDVKVVALPTKNGTTQSGVAAPSGLSAQPSSVTTDGNANISPLVVALSIKNSNDRTQSGAKTPSGMISQPSSVTTDRAGNDVKVVALPTKNGRTQSGATAPSGLSAQPSSVTTKAVPASYVASQAISTTGFRIARKFKPSDPLAKTILDCLDLLEGLSRCLDKEYKYGSCKCWKHVAERFGIEEQEYQKFNCSQVHSPTEVMFEYLQTRRPEITIGDVKDGLYSIERKDVLLVLVEYERTYHTVDSGTLVCSLFDSDPDIIGEIAFLLDMQKKGLKTWSALAASLEIPRGDFKTFETCNTDCPAAERLFELVKIHYPRTTVRDLISHLEEIKRQDVIVAIRKCTEVSGDSLLKDLMEDLDVMENVCELLNQKQRTKRVKNWSHLGRQYGIKKEYLDDLSPSQEEIVRPTEALIQYLSGSKPYSTLADLIWAIHLIDRDDALEVLNVYLQDGCIANLLRFCACQRCEKAREQEKGHANGL